VLCQITPAGLRVVESLDERMNELDDTTARTLTPEQLESLLEILSEIRAQIQE
jgi:DNA-binding MarR family transcriptional regulator